MGKELHLETLQRLRYVWKIANLAPVLCFFVSYECLSYWIHNDENSFKSSVFYLHKYIFFQVKSRAFNFSSRCRMNEAASGKKIIFRLKPFVASPLFVLAKTKAPVSFGEEVGIFAFYLY